MNETPIESVGGAAPEPKDPHVFISYAHLDDTAIPGREKGWISVFDETLKMFLTQQIGEDARVWRDTRMKRNAIYDKEIFQRLKESRTLVSVVTPGYVKSDYCLKELKKFCENAEPVGTHSRVFKVIKTHVELKKMPVPLPAINAYEFFTTDEKTKVRTEFVPEFGDKWGSAFLLKISDLAQQIAAMLEAIGSANVTNVDALPALALEAAPKIRVYLAETSSDFQKEHDNIRRDLSDRGYEVYPPPDIPVPRSTDEYKVFVETNLGSCGLAVHLIGENYGKCPEDGPLSFVHLQTLVAAAHDHRPNFRRIVWLHSEISKSDPRQAAFIDEILASALSGVEVLSKSLEEVKTNINEELALISRPPQPAQASLVKPTILVLYDHADSESGKALEKQVGQAGFEVWSVMNDLVNDDGSVLEAQRAYLRECDAVLIYSRESLDFWIKIMLQRVQKIFGAGREKGFLGKAVFDESGRALQVPDDLKAEIVTNADELDIYLKGVIDAYKTERKGGQNGTN